MRQNDDVLHKGIEFIEQNRARMIKIAIAELKDKGCADPEGDAEDVVNEVSLTLIMTWPTLRSPMDAMYVYTVNKARTHARTCRREYAFEIREHQVPVFSRPGRDPDEMIEELEFVEWAICNLSEMEASVFQMRFVLEMSFASIAEHLQKPIGTITSSYTRALEKLRKALEKTTAAPAANRRSPAPES